MVVNTAFEVEAVKSEEYLSLDNMYSLIPIEIRIHMQRVAKYCEILIGYMQSHDLFVDELTIPLVKNTRQVFIYHDLGYCMLPIKSMCQKLCDETGIKQFYTQEFAKLEMTMFENVKEHVKSARTIFNLPLFNELIPEIREEAINVAKYHHNFYDGSQGVDGLKKREIPFSARVCAVADEYCLLTTLMPYRVEDGNKAIIDEIIKQKNLKFQPEIVDILLKCADLFYEQDKLDGNCLLRKEMSS